MCKIILYGPILEAYVGDRVIMKLIAWAGDNREFIYFAFLAILPS